MTAFYRHRKQVLSLAGLIGVVTLAGGCLPGAQPGQGSSAQGGGAAAADKEWVGKKAGTFVLAGLDGKPVDVAKDYGKRPVVLVFYRGVW